mgnify:CR=1 FL=1
MSDFKYGYYDDVKRLEKQRDKVIELLLILQDDIQYDYANNEMVKTLDKCIFILKGERNE